MAHFLIVEDEAAIRREWKSLLEKENHTYVEAADVDQAIEAIDKSEKQCEGFDLILLDHHLGDETGVNLLENLDVSYCQHRIIVITGHASIPLAREYAKIGAIGHLIKPVSEIQFYITISSSLERRYIYVDEKENWESAYHFLQEIGLLDSIEKLNTDSAMLLEQYEALKAIYEQLINDLEKASNKDSEIAQAYKKASDTLNSTPGSFDSIIPFLNGFLFTPTFLSDIKKIFTSERLHFFILQSYLKRIKENPSAYRITRIVNTAITHFEYRIGKSYRLYFRKEGNTIILERFGHKNIQDKIISFLDKNCENYIENLLVQSCIFTNVTG
ncbi:MULTISPECIES: response regulator [Nostoc]|uniref:Response regulator n=1 Tax=Nostoc paludosum FACHB-159 TaxID=2692908 RepID=A0ABR8KHF8_9NOSO|nr:MULTISPECIES: response regulator [Nostoc]MBD2682646.1 response regulator [Nostoc sp. FACHB-857]MBD2738980.1 response regulator [Nostoc paludosum FACHB-159]